MTAPGTQGLVDAFTAQISDRLDPDKLDGPVRLDNTHTVVIIPLKDRGPIHARIEGGIGDQGVENVLRQIQSVPSLKGLVTEA